MTTVNIPNLRAKITAYISAMGYNVTTVKITSTKGIAGGMTVVGKFNEYLGKPMKFSANYRTSDESFTEFSIDENE